MADATTQVQDDEDLTVSGRILDVLRASELPEGCWDGAVDYILTGKGGWE
jgi:hypothetical protein